MTSTATTTDLVSDAYNTTSDIGQTMALFNAIVGTVVSLIIIGIGFYMMTQTGTIQGTTNNGQPTTMSDFDFGWILFGMGLIILFVVWIVYYFTTKSKAFAAFEGVSGVLSLFKHH